jgi:hypothetical protein
LCLRLDTIEIDRLLLEGHGGTRDAIFLGREPGRLLVETTLLDIPRRIDDAGQRVCDDSAKQAKLPLLASKADRFVRRLTGVNDCGALRRGKGWPPSGNGQRQKSERSRPWRVRRMRATPLLIVLVGDADGHASLDDLRK